MSARADNGWEFCGRCTGFESDDCDMCDAGDMFEPVDFAAGAATERPLHPTFDLILEVA